MTLEAGWNDALTVWYDSPIVPPRTREVVGPAGSVRVPSNVIALEPVDSAENPRKKLPSTSESHDPKGSSGAMVGSCQSRRDCPEGASNDTLYSPE